MYIKYSKQADKFLSKQTEKTQNRIRKAINSIPRGDIVKVQGTKYLRLKVGSFRVIFDNDGNVIYIVRIDNRGSVYKRI